MLRTSSHSADAGSQHQATLLADDHSTHESWQPATPGSPLATASAMLALAIAEREPAVLSPLRSETGDVWSVSYQTDLAELLFDSVRWLADQQNDDGGWGHVVGGPSNPFATIAVLSAVRATALPAKHGDLEPNAQEYLKQHGGVEAVRRSARDEDPLAEQVMLAAALAGVCRSSDAPASRLSMLAFEQTLRNRQGDTHPSPDTLLPIATRLVKQDTRRSPWPLSRLRRWETGVLIQTLLAGQSEDGSYFDDTGLTGVLVGAVAAARVEGHDWARNRMVRRGVEFLLATVRSDGSWPIAAHQGAPTEAVA